MYRCCANCLAVFLMFCSVTANASFLSTREGQIQVITKEVSYRTEGSVSQGIEQVIQNASGWILQADTPYVGTKGSILLWAKFDLPPAQESRRILINTSPWERADFFVVRDEQVVARQTSGSLVPWKERNTHVTMNPTISHSGFITVDQPPHSLTTVFARLETHSQYTNISRLRFYLWDAEQVLAAERHDRIFQGLFYGVMLFLIIYNLGLFVVTRELSFFFYGVMELGYVVLWGVLFGLTFEYLWPNHPQWEYRAFWLSAIIGGFGIAQFLRYYLELWKHLPKADLFLKWTNYLNLLSIPAALLLPINFEFLAIAMLWGVPLFIPVIVFIIVRAVALRHPLAPNLLSAILCMSVGITVFAGQELDILPTLDVTVHAAQIGSALAGIVLSIGLGLRWQLARMDVADLMLKEEQNRSAHERDKRELAEEHNRSLEAKVEERTAELIASKRMARGVTLQPGLQQLVLELQHL